MNRRQFLTYTVALAVAAPLARLGVMPTDAAEGSPLPVYPDRWVPTQVEVDEWLAYYKVAVRTGVERFADVVNTVFANTGYEERAQELLLYEEAERAWLQLSRDRQNVAFSQGYGYAAGLDGKPRFCGTYTGPSHEGFGWYNMWAVGHADRVRREVKSR